MTIEFLSPNEIIEELVTKIKEKQQLRGFTIEQISLHAGIDRKTYEHILYKKSCSVINLIKILVALELTNELNILIKPIVALNEEEHKKLNKIRERKKKQDAKKVSKKATTKTGKEMLKNKLFVNRIKVEK